MPKVKLLLYGIATIIVAGLFVSLITLYNQNIKKDIEIARLDFNNFQLLRDAQSQTVLYLKEKEVTGKLKKERDSIALSLKIKPKQVEKVIYRTVVQTEYDTVPVFVELKKTHWDISDKGNCFVWSGMAFLSDDSLRVERTGFTYQNKTTEVYYRERSKKFLFIKFGKWQNMRKDSSECGGVVLREFNFVK